MMKKPGEEIVQDIVSEVEDEEEVQEMAKAADEDLSDIIESLLLASHKLVKWITVNF